jgi:hypothetical protein
VAAMVVIAGAMVFAVAWFDRGAEEASLDRAVAEARDHSASAAAGFLEPATGVYVYQGTGTEHLSLLGTSQDWGPRLPGVVERAAHGCWTFKIEYNSHHWQSTTLCPRVDALDETADKTFQQFDFVVTSVDDLNVIVCDPPVEVIRVAARPGSSSHHSCVGHSRQQGTKVISTGTNTFVGADTVDVGGTQVPAVQYRSDRVLSGDQTGEEHTETWYRLADGLPLKSTRDVRVDSSSPVGTVTYTERGSYTLTSLVPRR